MLSNSLIIAVDFDGTIVDDEYPKIGESKVFAFETMHKLIEDGHRLVLWTYRHGEKLEEAVEFCTKNGIEFYAVNESYENEIMDKRISRKINADIFIDDRNIGGFIGWGEIYQLIVKQPIPVKSKKSKKGLMSIFKK